MKPIFLYQVLLPFFFPQSVVTVSAEAKHTTLCEPEEFSIKSFHDVAAG